VRFVHTSDWHIGRTLANESLQPDQEHLLDQVFNAVADTNADALIIAGDIFDRAAPRKEAVALFNDFLRRIYSQTRAAIIAIAGNHDAPERIGFNNALQDSDRVLIRGPLSDPSKPLILSDEHGQVAFSALPYAEIFAAREAFADQTIAAPADVLVAQVRAARAHVPLGARWVITAHAFVEGGVLTETERPLTMVGGIETVASGAFDGAHYVALGHLHRAQPAGALHIRYCGSWMGFNFDEAGETKSLSLVELNGAGEARVQAVDLSCRRPLLVIIGELQQLLREGRTWPEGQRQALIKAVLTDEGALLDAMGQLRAVFPHVLQLERQRRQAPQSATRDGAINRQDPHAVVSGFLEAVRGTGPDAGEASIINEVLHDLQREEA
jgi:exonuclease SbcD